MAKIRYSDNSQKEFSKLFERLCGTRGRWEIWSDFIQLSAYFLALNNTKRLKDRDKFIEIITSKYSVNEQKCLTQMFDILVDAYEDNPDQDLLGDLYMRLELGNGNIGQFFTPYHVCKAIAVMQCVDIEKQIADRGYISVNDCACGAGAMLIAYANQAKLQGVNYQKHILFVAQDIDYITAMMCYIQLSLLGCAGYVIVGDTLATPPTEKLENMNVWYTPMYFTDVWKWRRLFKRMSKLNYTPAKKPKGKETEDNSIHGEKIQQQEFAEGKNGQLMLF